MSLSWAYGFPAAVAKNGRITSLPQIAYLISDCFKLNCFWPTNQSLSSDRIIIIILIKNTLITIPTGNEWISDLE